MARSEFLRSRSVKTANAKPIYRHQRDQIRVRLASGFSFLILCRSRAVRGESVGGRKNDARLREPRRKGRLERSVYQDRGIRGLVALKGEG